MVIPLSNVIYDHKERRIMGLLDPWGCSYDDDGYDSEGYNRKGFNRKGVHRNGTSYDDGGYATIANDTTGKE